MKTLESPAAFLEDSPRTSYFKEPWSGPGIHDYEPADLAEANMVSSLLTSGKHAPLIDLDVPHRCVPSSTTGHSHLYIDVQMPWWKYRLLLWVLMFTGVIDVGFYRMSILRRKTLVRKPGVYKHTHTASWGNSDPNDNWGGYP